VPVGREALRAVTGFYEISKHRGSVYPFKDSWVVPTYHPALLTRGGRINKRGAPQDDGGIPVEPIMFMDLRKALDIERDGFEYKERDRKVIDDYALFANMMWRLSSLYKDKPLAVDIETENDYISCIGIAVSPTQSYCVTLRTEDGDIFSDNYYILYNLAQLLSTREIIGQNFSYDMAWLDGKHGIETPNYFFDTMVAQNVCFPEFPMGLDFMTSIMTDMPYYKDDGKDHKKVKDYDKLWIYNCNDVLATYECYEKLSAHLDEIEQRDIFEFQMRTTKLAYKAAMRGFRIDHDKRERWLNQISREIGRLREEANFIAGRRINLSSPLQLKKYLYEELGLEIEYAPNGKVTTNENAIKRMKDKYEDIKFLTLLERHRKLVKFNGTYCKDKTDEDGKFRCSYSWTKRARLRSYESPFRTGANMQNIPRRVDI
jgi:DNA polymerase I-like protein with 3'-5' exonuclease and polymerase domains